MQRTLILISVSHSHKRKHTIATTGRRESTHRRIATHDGAAPLRRRIATTIATASHRHRHLILHPTAPLRRPTAPLRRRRASLPVGRRQARLLLRRPYSLAQALQKAMPCGTLYL
ncbi:uncharacterized protein DS421_1g04950 [Arachis hypogaea]|nr:uncharacterized protein DS421_1g04950 [Arachis hypogaea]